MEPPVDAETAADEDAGQAAKRSSFGAGVTPADARMGFAAYGNAGAGDAGAFGVAAGALRSSPCRPACLHLLHAALHGMCYVVQNQSSALPLNAVHLSHASFTGLHTQLMRETHHYRGRCLVERYCCGRPARWAAHTLAPHPRTAAAPAQTMARVMGRNTLTSQCFHCIRGAAAEWSRLQVWGLRDWITKQ